MEEAQAEAEEVRQKEVTAAKFQYASITFDTFKPPDNLTAASSPPLYQPELDKEHDGRMRLPSFARNYNPASNRAMLARSYEIVTPISSADGAGPTTNPPANGALQQEEYDKLVHQERKMTGSSQRNFSISVKPQMQHATDYSQLQLKAKPKQNDELGVKKIKPQIKKRTLVPGAEKKLVKSPSYSTVVKPKAPPLPPRVEDTPEDHYKVPLSRRVLQDGHNPAGLYDHPSSLLRVAWSCENVGSQYPSQQQQQQVLHMNGGFYDSPSSPPRPHIARSQRSLVHDEPSGYVNLANNSLSMDSYIDMTSQVSYV